MQCPSCNTQFELTWRRYLQAPTGRHRCPACKATFRLARSLRYWLLTLAFAALVLGGVVGVAHATDCDCAAAAWKWPATAGLMLLLSALYMVLDRHLENRMGSRPV
ncbi:MAG: hypothetical protein V4812_07360 [Pseudomonadota bacterium]